MEFMTKVKLVVFGIVAVLVLIVFFQNNETVSTEILFVTISAPRSIMLIFTLLLGFVMGMVASVFLRRRKSKSKSA